MTFARAAPLSITDENASPGVSFTPPMLVLMWRVAVQVRVIKVEAVRSGDPAAREHRKHPQPLPTTLNLIHVNIHTGRGGREVRSMLLLLPSPWGVSFLTTGQCGKHIKPVKFSLMF